ncbi:MAG: hypothetical protein ACK449_05905 [Planctomycetota bacterium]
MEHPISENFARQVATGTCSSDVQSIEATVATVVDDFDRQIAVREIDIEGIIGRGVPLDDQTLDTHLAEQSELKTSKIYIPGSVDGQRTIENIRAFCHKRGPNKRL